MQKFFLLLQNIDQCFRPEHEPYLKYPKEEYRLTSDDTFIDIGSGFGKPVFHAAMQIGWKSKGIEIVPARVEFSIDFVFEYETKNDRKIKLEDKRLETLEVEKSKYSLTPLKAKRERKANNSYYCNPLATEESTYEETKNGNQPHSSNKTSKN